MSTTAPPQSALTRAQIEATIATLPPVYRVMLRLLLLRYLDPTLDDITFMARERSEPMNRAGGNASLRVGGKPIPEEEKILILPKDWIVAIEAKVNQFRTQLREQRGRLDLQTTFLGDYLEGLRSELEALEHLLTTGCGTSQETLDDLRSQAKLAPVVYAMKKLAVRAEKQEIEEEEYVRERLSLEYQSHIRRWGRFTKRLDQVLLERQATLMSSLSDEFLATIWGIARSPVMDRHVKAVQKFVSALATITQGSLDQGEFAAAVNAGIGPKLPGGSKNEGIGSKPLVTPGDLWSRAIQALAAAPATPPTPKPCAHDGGGKILVSRLRNMATYVLGEDDEIPLWTRTAQCLHCLNVLRAAQVEAAVVGQPAGVVMERVKARTAMPRKEAPEAATPQAPAPPKEMSEELELILKNFIGDDAGQAGAKSWW